MSSLGITVAGLIFGDEHYLEIVKRLEQNGIGYISFFPGGKPEVNEENEKAGLEYILKI